MNKNDFRIMVDSRRLMLNVADLYEDAELLAQSVRNNDKKQVAFDSLVMAFDLGRIAVQQARIAMSLTHIKMMLKDPRHYVGLSMDGVEQALPRFRHLGELPRARSQ